MQPESPIQWSEIKKKREEIKALYPSINRIPLIYSTKKALLAGLLSEIKGKILDIGAGDRFINDICSKLPDNIIYKSMDTDRSRHHDYYSMSDISDSFNALLLLDIIEHLPLNEGISLLQKCFSLLQPEGRIIITLPNNYHPTAFNGDCTHITSYRCHDLGGILSAQGFKDIKIFRVSARKKFKHRLTALLYSPVMKLLDIDFATGILITGIKP
ncbi:MAG: hypothetical protein HY807_01485 [Nitrospirae bacterium]|nr:hypothetical protein [Nitrospirota bacterium]